MTCTHNHPMTSVLTESTPVSLTYVDVCSRCKASRRRTLRADGTAHNTRWYPTQPNPVDR